MNYLQPVTLESASHDDTRWWAGGLAGGLTGGRIWADKWTGGLTAGRAYGRRGGRAGGHSGRRGQADGLGAYAGRRTGCGWAGASSISIFLNNDAVIPASHF